MLEVDRLSLANRWRHRALAEKLVLALGLLALAVTLPVWPGAALVAVVAAVALVAGAGIPARSLGRVVLVPAGFVLTGAVAVAVTVGPHAGPWWVAVADGGPARAGALVARAVAALLALQVLALTTPLVDLLPRLRQVGVPAAVCEVMGLVHRMLFLTAAEAARLRTAQQLRLGWSGFRRSLSSLAMLVSRLFVAVLHRSRRMEAGLAARGYRGELPVLVEAPPARAAVVAGHVALLVAVAGVALVVAARWPLGGA